MSNAERQKRCREKKEAIKKTKVKIKDTKTTKEEMPKNTQTKVENKKVLVTFEHLVTEIIGVTLRQGRNLRADGVIVMEPDKKNCDFVKNIIRIVRYYREKVDIKKGYDVKSLTDAKTRQALAKAESDEIKNAVMRKELHKSAHIEKLIGLTFSQLRITGSAIPMSVAPLIAEKFGLSKAAMNYIAEVLDERLGRMFNLIADLDINKLLENEEDEQDGDSEED
jgi:phage terminase Nu1 subunit (DNA packaging protein)